MFNKLIYSLVLWISHVIPLHTSHWKKPSAELPTREHHPSYFESSSSLTPASWPTCKLGFEGNTYWKYISEYDKYRKKTSTWSWSCLMTTMASDSRADKPLGLVISWHSMASFLSLGSWGDSGTNALSCSWSNFFCHDNVLQQFRKYMQ
jgi:hypothetical protein